MLSQIAIHYVLCQAHWLIVLLEGEFKETRQVYRTFHVIKLNWTNHHEYLAMALLTDFVTIKVFHNLQLDYM